MGLPVTPEGVLERSRLPAGDADKWPISYLLRAEYLWSLSCDLAIAIRDSMVRLPSRCGVARIQVSPMSLTWLQMHEIECEKHRAEF
jgi:hypothetical protein